MPSFSSCTNPILDDSEWEHQVALATSKAKYLNEAEALLADRNV